MKNKYETNYNKKDRKNTIKNVIPGSISDQMGITKGYKLVSINKINIDDILDYKFAVTDEYLEMEFINLKGQLEIFEVEKEEYEDLGLVFETELIDKPKNCHNKCIFCFMEQLPLNVRETLIFKDDDYRLSFFTGNYITLTNMKESDIDRIIKYRLSPINISLHTTDEEIRCKMLNNKNAGKVLKYIDKLNKADISMNLQIVLCKGINDGDVLRRTLEDIKNYMPNIKSVSIVPVGLTKFRKGLNDLKPLEKEDCIKIIEIVNNFQKQYKKLYNTNLVYLSDEFYVKANINIPAYKEYEDFAQLENGVGMLAVFEHEFNKEIKKLKKKIDNKIVKQMKNKIIILTGKITYDFIKSKIGLLKELNKNLDIEVRYVENNHFGENITVTGLMVLEDILNTLKDVEDNSYIILPDVCLKEDENIFLDNMKLTDLKDKYSNTIVSETSAKGLMQSIYKII